MINTKIIILMKNLSIRIQFPRLLRMIYLWIMMELLFFKIKWRMTLILLILIGIKITTGFRTIPDLIPTRYCRPSKNSNLQLISLRKEKNWLFNFTPSSTARTWCCVASVSVGNWQICDWQQYWNQQIANFNRCRWLRKITNHWFYHHFNKKAWLFWKKYSIYATTGKAATNIGGSMI